MTNGYCEEMVTSLLQTAGFWGLFVPSPFPRLFIADTNKVTELFLGDCGRCISLIPYIN